MEWDEDDWAEMKLPRNGPLTDACIPTLQFVRQR